MPLAPRRHALTLLAFATLALAPACSREPREPTPASPTEAAFADFARRIDAYMALRKQAVDSVGDLDPTRSQAEIATRATALASSIVARRAQARQGDIFTIEIATILATLIKEEYRRRPEAVQETREDQEDEVPAFVPQVNQRYPTNYPLATFPATLLPLLPPLPEELEYRVVQKHLVLRDVEANLILDVMPDAVP